ncbi:hypothetical protein BDN71DRAFT_1507460 [Pleurotus eryngii]|uniref:Uncharacterized protein n=1 Tax=Pleurotus eryngii TaxID=5323 RepID=A0A9P6DEY2_PLEER|nr:hypothetical protein BDN71DRAFT_1507460 [Pleurotus eryngii]
MDFLAVLVVLFVHVLQTAGSAIQARKIPGLLFNLRVSSISAHFTGASLLSNQLSRVDFDFAPVLPLPLGLTSATIDSVTLTAVSGLTTIFTVEKTFDPALEVPSEGSVNSGVFTDVPLTQGSAATLSAVSSGILIANGQWDTHVTIITSPLTLPLPLTTVDPFMPTAWSISFF